MGCQMLFTCLGFFVLASVFLGTTEAERDDKYSCPLNASSPFSWVVMIWDENKDAKAGSDGTPGTATMGSLITCNAVLTTAYYYNTRVLNDRETFLRLNKFKRFRVIGQNIYDRNSGNGRKNPCYQNMTVTNIDLHPKSKVLGQRILFDFAVVVMTKPFRVDSPTFPTMFFPSSAVELILAIRYVNIIQSETYCAIPTPENFNLKAFIWHDRLDVRSKLFHSQCIVKLCEQKLPVGHATLRPHCVEKLNQMLNGTMLCMIPQWQTRLGFPSNNDGTLYPNVLAGLPLICNGSTLGMSNFVKTRGRESYPDYAQDIYFTITLLRALPWLIQEIKDHTPPIKPFYIEEKALTRVDITEPPRLTTENWGSDYFFSLPTVDNPFPPPQRYYYPYSTATLAASICLKSLVASVILHVNLFN